MGANPRQFLIRCLPRAFLARWLATSARPTFVGGCSTSLLSGNCPVSRAANPRLPSPRASADRNRWWCRHKASLRRPVVHHLPCATKRWRGGRGRRPVSSINTLIVEPSITSKPMRSPPRLRRGSSAGQSATSTCSISIRNRVANGVIPSGYAQNSLSCWIRVSALRAASFSLRGLIDHWSFSIWSLRVSLHSRVMSSRANALSSGNPISSKLLGV